jgi:hypothetical protein
MSAIQTTPTEALGVYAANRRLAHALGACASAVTSGAAILRPLSVGAASDRRFLPGRSSVDASSSGREGDQ